MAVYSKELISRAGERVAGALGVLLGALLMMWGTTWDIQWHVRVGRDSFLIPPHLVLYAGLMVIIGTVGVLILRETLAPATGGISLLGLRAGAGTWLSAAGTATMLLAAPFDDWWHRTFGLDVTLWSPPHLMGVAGAAIILCGALATLGFELGRGALTPGGTRWAWTGLLVGFGLLMGPFNLAIQPASRLSVLTVGAGPFLYPLLAALALPPVLAASRAATFRRWGALTTALIAFGLAIVANQFAVLGFRVVFPSGLPDGGVRLGPALGVLRMLPLLPALTLDVLAGPPGLGRWRDALGATGWAAVLLVEVMLIQGRITGSLPMGSALAVFPPMALVAILSAAVGSWIGGRIAAPTHVPQPESISPRQDLQQWGSPGGQG